MAGYVENRILVRRDYDFTFDLTNRVDLWTTLFTEYKEATVLERDGDTLRFRLTTYPEGQRPSRTWVSRRVMDKAGHLATAERIEPLFPFGFMKIRWEYEPLPREGAVLMTWIQEFEVHKECPLTTEQMESLLNRNTRLQMASVKGAVEAWKGDIP